MTGADRHASDAFDPAGTVARARQAAADAGSLEALGELRGVLLGKRGELVRAQRALGGVAPEERRRLGEQINSARAEVEEVLAARQGQLRAEERARRLAEERLDLTEVVDVPRRGRVHVVERTRRQLEDVFVGMGFAVVEGPEVEDDWHNFEALNMPIAHPARGMWDTLYLELGPPESVVLRTHTSPVQIRLMQRERPPVYAVMPGRCYRRDTPDARHIPIFHQIEGLVVDKGISFSDLAGTIETFTGAYFGTDIHSRLRPSFFPFTEPSAEYEITCTICRGAGCRTCSQTGWIELGGCGMVDPAVFAAVGVDPEEWTGFAFGFGIDRCAQMRHQLPDMRVLLENDVRVLEQL
ncbi:MAG: phenylalanine--tRNA ligase subunit alpha [Acidobacteriota bacterium]|nr:phenylalanine--tRNA ligase subunit alpha [Acidobacteriota bacterium]